MKIYKDAGTCPQKYIFFKKNKLKNHMPFKHDTNSLLDTFNKG